MSKYYAFYRKNINSETNGFEIQRVKRVSFLSLIKKLFTSVSLCLVLVLVNVNSVFASEEEFVPAYQNEGNFDFEFEDYNKYIAYKDGRKYYTSGKPNGIRVNENNEESTDETIGILTFVIVPATLIYMNFIGWWE